MVLFFTLRIGPQPELSGDDPHINCDRLWFNGFWPRFAILTPEDGRPEWQVPDGSSEPRILAGRLQELDKRLPAAEHPNPPEAVTVVLAEGVYEAWLRLNKALSYDLLTPGLPAPLWATYARLPVMLIKVATILAALDWAEGHAPSMELAHLARALSIVEGWRASAHRVLGQAITTKADQLRERILAHVTEQGAEGATARDVYRRLRSAPSTTNDILKEMAQEGTIESLPATSDGPGRPTIRYRARSS